MAECQIVARNVPPAEADAVVAAIRADYEAKGCTYVDDYKQLKPDNSYTVYVWMQCPDGVDCGGGITEWSPG